MVVALGESLLDFTLCFTSSISKEKLWKRKRDAEKLFPGDSASAGCGSEG